MNEKLLFMIRHGRLINSHEGVLNGQNDTPLSEIGFEETIAWKDMLQEVGIDLILSSDLSRTFLPASKYREILKCPHMAFEELREINAGKWELKRVSDLLVSQKEAFLKRAQDPVRIPFPEGENLLQLKKRAKKLIDGFLKDKKWNKILYIGHGGVIKVLILTYLGISLKSFFKFEIDYGSLTILRFFEDGNVTLKVLNTRNNSEIIK
ncbi:MAG: histidine phosphatase family protein [Proteobacteria bacterium]|nr:histidine phosphatase family protein [Pseudomonadota bacterium]